MKMKMIEIEMELVSRNTKMNNEVGNLEEIAERQLLHSRCNNQKSRAFQHGSVNPNIVNYEGTHEMPMDLVKMRQSLPKKRQSVHHELELTTEDYVAAFRRSFVPKSGGY